jgi:hypothetical protein
LEGTSNLNRVSNLTLCRQAAGIETFAKTDRPLNIAKLQCDTSFMDKDICRAKCRPNVIRVPAELRGVSRSNL